MRAEQNQTEPNRTEPNRTEPNRTEQNRTPPNTCSVLFCMRARVGAWLARRGQAV